MPRRTLAVIGRIDPLQFIVQDAIGAVRIYDSHHIKLFPGLLDISNVGQWRYRMMSMRLICVTGATEFMLSSVIPYWRDLTWGLRDRRGMPPDCVAGSALIQRLRRVFILVLGPIIRPDLSPGSIGPIGSQCRSGR